MPTSATAATAAPRSLGEINGQEWFISPLDEKGWTEYLAWVKGLYIDEQKAHAADLDPDIKATVLEKAFERLGRMTLDSPEAKPVTESPVGIFRLIWMHLRPRHPDVSMAQVAEIVNTPALRERATALVRQSSSDELASKKKRASPKRPTRKKKRVSTRVQQRKRPRN